MTEKRIYFFVEGEDDIRFFSTIIQPILEDNGYVVSIHRHTKMKDEKVNNFIKSIESMNQVYYYCEDLDLSPCCGHKKNKIITRMKNINNDNIIIVVKEIESWYLAGISKDGCKKIKIKDVGSTDDLIKEQFQQVAPTQFSLRDFKIELLKRYSLKEGIRRNKSLHYFTKRVL